MKSVTDSAVQRSERSAGLRRRSATGRPPSSRRLAPGCVLAGKYRLLGLLGEGGMGTVWHAHSAVLDVDVAIKVLRGDRIDELASDRLRREAQATAALGHPAIVRVFEFGETPAGEPFLVMVAAPEGLSLAGGGSRSAAGFLVGGAGGADLLLLDRGRARRRARPRHHPP